MCMYVCADLYAPQIFILIPSFSFKLIQTFRLEIFLIQYIILLGIILTNILLFKSNSNVTYIMQMKIGEFNHAELS